MGHETVREGGDGQGRGAEGNGTGIETKRGKGNKLDRKLDRDEHRRRDGCVRKDGEKMGMGMGQVGTKMDRF